MIKRNVNYTPFESIIKCSNSYHFRKNTNDEAFASPYEMSENNRSSLTKCSDQLSYGFPVGLEPTTSRLKGEVTAFTASDKVILSILLLLCQ